MVNNTLLQGLYLNRWYECCNKQECISVGCLSPALYRTGKGGLCPGGLCLGGHCPEGHLCPEGSLYMGSLSRGGLCPGGICHCICLWTETPWRETSQKEHGTRDKDPLEGTWDERHRPPGGTRDQAARQEVTPPPVDRQMLPKALPCPKFRFRAVIIKFCSNFWSSRSNNRRFEVLTSLHGLDLKSLKYIWNQNRCWIWPRRIYQ